MPVSHTARPGDSLLALAYAHGFPTWRTIWNDDANAKLRESRTDPQVLAPGDVVTIPEKGLAPEACPVDKSHKFRLTRPRAWVNLHMIDNQGEALSELRYTLRIGDRVYEGTTAKDGMISVEIHPSAEHGKLTIWLEEPDVKFEAIIRVGHLNPANTPSGARARLRNLGIECANEDGDDLDSCPSTRDAIALFQAATEQELRCGRLDDQTTDALLKAHG